MAIEETTTGIKKKFVALTFNPMPTSELDKRTLLLADEVDKLKKSYYNLNGIIWALRNKEKLKK